MKSEYYKLYIDEYIAAKQLARDSIGQTRQFWEVVADDALLLLPKGIAKKVAHEYSQAKSRISGCP